MKKWLKNSWKWLKNFGITILFALFAIFVFIGLVFTILLFQKDPQLAGAYTAVGTLILASVTAFLAFFTFLSVKSGYDREKRERKERLLKEIMNWVTDIQKASLEVDIPASKEQIRVREANTLLRYAIAFGRNTYIKAIASRAFKEELQQDVENMINAFTVFLFLKGKSFGMENPGQIFKGTAVEIIEAVEKRLKEKALPELLSEYSEEKSRCANILLTKVGNIVASL